ncbi:MAG: hypothetical protein IJ470_05120 [Clostridia bacterium]|nr:hypothetical protein [Clostridia bacterium]
MSKFSLFTAELSDSKEQVFEFDDEKGFYYLKFTSIMSEDYSGKYHPEKVVYTGATVGGIHTGGIHKEDAYVSVNETDNGRGYVQYGKCTVNSVTLSENVLKEAKKNPALNRMINGNRISLIKPFTGEQMQRIQNMSIANYNAYSQIELANMQTSRYIPYNESVEVVNFLNKVLDGDITPEATEILSKMKAISNKEKELQRDLQNKAAKERRKKLSVAFSVIVAVVVTILVISKIYSFIKYKPLSDNFNNNNITVEYIQNNYPNLQYDKGALKVFANELEECHKQNDLKRALDILTILAESDVVFGDEKYDNTGRTALNPHISSWFSFTEWIYAQAQSDGQKIPTENHENVDETYEVYGYKLSIKISNIGDIYEVDVSVPSIGWYSICASKKTSANIKFHFQRGGIMVE